MKIVIDIPDEQYKRICDHTDGVYDMISLLTIIENGTPLPKGHGKLIDADKLIKKLEATANIEWNKQVGSSKGLKDAIDIIDDDVPTIIEADKGSEVDE